MLSDVICHNGFTKEKVMLHSSDLFEFGSDANTTDVRCKVAYKVSMSPSPVKYYIQLFRTLLTASK